MKILALEFSSERRSVAVAEGEATGHARVLGEASVQDRRPTPALALVEAALAQAALAREAIECIAVGLGPGSYTGIRIAIALAQGWALARAVRLLGISSVEVLARQGWSQGWRGPVTFAIDAQRQEFYVATYDLNAARPGMVSPLRLAPVAEVKAHLLTGAVVAGPDAAALSPQARAIFPTAAGLAKLAVGRTDFVPGEHLEPIYLRVASFAKAPAPRVV